MSRGRRRSRRARLGALTFVATVLGTATVATAQEVPADDDAVVQLARAHAPIILTVAQDEPCDTDGEAFAPSSVEVVLDNPEVLLRQVGNGDPVVKVAPSASDLFELGEGFYLDFPGGALEPGCVYERDFRRYTRDLPPTVYAHLVVQPDEPDRLALQYWFYWYYNDWNNKHESDWEGIQLLFDTGSVEEAIDRGPVSIGYAQHEGGESASWDSDKLEREGDRPVVYPSAGSHASYFEADLHLGRGASEGFGCDTTIGPSTRIDPEVVVLPDTVDDPDDPLAWVEFDGRWGERHGGPFNGPTGPTSKPRWTHPVDWHDELRSSSVLMPGGDSAVSGLITTFCDVVEWGSGRFISLTLSPLRLVATAAVAIWLVGRLVRRSDWSVVDAFPLERRRRGGQILRAAFRLLGRMPSIALIGLAFLPLSVLAGAFGRLVASLPFFHQLLSLAGTDGLPGLVLALAVAASAGLVTFVAVNATIAVHLAREAKGLAGVRRSLRTTWEDAGPLVSAFLRVYAVVVVAAITVVGLPVAVYVLVRSQFIAHVVTCEGVDGRTAVRRSGELVRGRWWHTAVMVAVINASVAGFTVVTGLLLLIVFSALPLWLFSGLLTLVTAVVSPIAAVALSLLYGDAVAESEDLPAATRPGEAPAEDGVPVPAPTTA